MRSARPYYDWFWAAAVVLAVVNIGFALRRCATTPRATIYRMSAQHAAEWLKANPPADGQVLIVLPSRTGKDDECEFKLKFFAYPLRPQVAYMPVWPGLLRNYRTVLAFRDARPAIEPLGRVTARDELVSRVDFDPAPRTATVRYPR